MANENAALLERQIAATFLVPPAILGPRPPMDTARQRADYIKLMSESMGIDPLVAAESDPAAQGVILRDRLRAMGVL